MKKSFTILLFVTAHFYAQISEITQFPLQEWDRLRHGIIVHNNNDEMLFFWSENSQINLVKSSDSGINWSAKEVISDSSASYFRSVVTNSGRIILAFKMRSSNSGYCYSDDNGTTWSEVISLSLYGSPNFNLSKGLDNRIWITYSPSTSNKIYYKESTDNGETWSSGIQLWDDNDKVNTIGDLIQLDDSTLYATAKGSLNDSTNSVQIIAKYSYDNGISWGDYSIIYSSEKYIKTMQTLKLKGDSIKIVINQEEYILDPGIAYDMILYLNSFDGGKNWSAPIPFTKYIGYNFNPAATEHNGKVYVVFTSGRLDYRLNLWYGILGESDDTKAPPVINFVSYSPNQLGSGDTLSVRAYVVDYNEISKVSVIPTVNNEVRAEIEMFDDGMHNDLNMDDGYYGATIGSFSANDTIVYNIVATDIDGNTAEEANQIIYEYASKRKEYLVEVNKFKLPINNEGVLGDVRVGNEKTSGRYDSGNVLFSGGFGLSGYADGELWANANLTASRIEDYIAGPIGSEPDDTLNMIYILRSDDKPFGSAWQTWKTAVELGAKFYDGDGDGLYNPLDLNGNEAWDENEDRPDLIGDVTTWTLFNDGKPSDQRAFSDMFPRDIEVRQTLFAYSPIAHPELDGVVFIRYIFENKSQVDYDSVYFATMSDADIGAYFNDMSGCDTIINSGYTYDNLIDEDFGNSPTIMSTVIQGAPVYIAGETFLDNNNNGFYDIGIDTPIDTAKNNNGEFLSEQKFAGAKNQTMTSFINYLKSNPTQGDADNAEQLRNYMLGLRTNGDLINPCDWNYGSVFDEDCETINPRFKYSGNPVTQSGWICTINYDHRMLVNSGPFNLKMNEPVEIIVAYSVGRGSTSLESIDVTKNIVNDVIGFYNTNFSYVPVGVKENPKTELPTEFSLSQNYPNPFNPSTVIKYQVPSNVKSEMSNTKLIVYDILGREVATLVNQQQKPGNYEVAFIASNLSSGVYIYSLKSGSYYQSKKMILIK